MRKREKMKRHETSSWTPFDGFCKNPYVPIYNRILFLISQLICNPFDQKREGRVENDTKTRVPCYEEETLQEDDKSQEEERDQRFLDSFLFVCGIVNIAWSSYDLRNVVWFVVKLQKHSSCWCLFNNMYVNYKEITLVCGMKTH